MKKGCAVHDFLERQSLQHPKLYDRETKGFVVTPCWLAKYMIDMIPSSIWVKRNVVFLDPCCGFGIFPLFIFEELWKSSTIECKTKRALHILEICIVFWDILPKNIQMTKYRLQKFAEHKIGAPFKRKIKWQSTCCNALSANIPKNVSVVVCNPPYNENKLRHNGPYLKPIYPTWVYHFTSKVKNALFVIPAKWFTSNEKNLSLFRKYLWNQSLGKAVYLSEEDLFQDVKIKGGVFLFYKKENNTKRKSGQHNANNDIVILPKFSKIVHCLRGHFIPNLSTLYCSARYFVADEKNLQKEKQKDNVLCYVSKAKGFIKYIHKDRITNFFQFYKIITCAASYKGSSGFSTVIFGGKNCVHTASYISFRVPSKQAATSLYSYLQCKFPHVLLAARKISHNISMHTLDWIPLPPLDRIWKDETLFEFFSVPKHVQMDFQNIKIEGSFHRSNHRVEGIDK